MPEVVGVLERRCGSLLCRAISGETAARITLSVHSCAPLTRAKLNALMAALPPCVIGIEACSGAHPPSPLMPLPARGKGKAMGGSHSRPFPIKSAAAGGVHTISSFDRGRQPLAETR
jgi:hypothetical protein